MLLLAEGTSDERRRELQKDTWQLQSLRAKAVNVKVVVASPHLRVLSLSLQCMAVLGAVKARRFAPKAALTAPATPPSSEWAKEGRKMLMRLDQQKNAPG